MNTYINLDTISEFIRTTNSGDFSIASDELIRISSIIQKIELNNDNIHCVLKLIANLTKFDYVIDSDNICFNYDIDKLITFVLGSSYGSKINVKLGPKAKTDSFDSVLSTSPVTISHIFEYIKNSSNCSAEFTEPAELSDSADSAELSDSADSAELSDSADSAESAESLFSQKSSLRKKKTVSDGNIISLVNILCSKKYNLPYIAIELVNKYDIHKTSSYIPIFKSFIETKNFDGLVSFYKNYLTKNQIILEQNRKIKEFNHKIRFYNEKIKLMKRKYSEFCTISDEIGKINIPFNTHTHFKTFCSNISDELFNEITPRNERNIIELSNDIIRDIICFATEQNNVEFIHTIISSIENPSQDIISVLNVYFNKFNYDIIYGNVHNGKCSCCNNYVPNNVISDIDRLNIMKRISEKILSTTHRHDNGQLISKSERQNIINKWTEFDNILKTNNFDLIVDGANLGYVSSKGIGDINIKFIQNSIRDIITKTNKKVLLILHQRHTQKIKQLNFPPSVSSNLRIYTTPNNVNDDWFWLYASIYSKSFILTNDQSRDHGCMVAYQNEIKKWTQNYQIPINIIDASIPEKVYNTKKSIITPGIFINDDIIHIITGNNYGKNCICIHMT